MTIDKEKLKPAIEYILKQEQKNHLDDADAHDAAWSIYDAEVTPAAVLDLIVERNLLLLCANKWEEAALTLGAERDQLKAENEELRTKAQDALAGQLLLTNERDLLIEARDEARYLRNKLGDRYDDAIAELAGLRTGYDAQNEVIAQLKAENEALRKDDLRAGLMAVAAYIGPICTAAVVAAMSKGEQP